MVEQTFYSFLLLNVFYRFTLEHYVPPPNFCLFAQTCNHTWIPLCGLDINIKHNRMFLDECDMFEYNCDNHKEYYQTEFDNCSEETTEPLTNPTQTSLMEHTPINETVQSTVSMSTTTKMTTTQPINHTRETSLDITTEDMNNVTNFTTKQSITSESPINVTTTPLTTTQLTTTQLTTTPLTTTQLTTTQLTTTSLTTTSLTTTPLTTTPLTTTPLTTTPLTTTPLTTTSLTTTPLTTTPLTTTPLTTTLLTTTPPTTTPLTTTTTLPTIQTTTEELTEFTTTEGKNISKESKPTLTSCTARPFNATTPHTSLNENFSSITTEQITIPITSTPSTTTNTTTVETTITTTKKQMLTNMHTCDTFPEHCDRPKTWETTVKGETRDFFQILKARFGNRFRILEDTTHWPRRVTSYINDVDNDFQFGRHNEGKEFD